LRTQTGGSPFWSGWWKGSSRPTAPRLDASQVEPKPPSDSSMGTSTGKVQQGYSCAASSPTKGANCYGIFTRELAAIMQPPGQSSAALSRSESNVILGRIQSTCLIFDRQSN
jgi:hypothetical protein